MTSPCGRARPKAIIYYIAIYTGGHEQKAYHKFDVYYIVYYILTHYQHRSVSHVTKSIYYI